MKRNWILLNLALCAIALLLTFQLKKHWQAYRKSHNSAQIQPQATQPSRPPGFVSRQATPPNYSAIVDKHLFNLERNNVIPVDAPPPSEPKVLAPKPILMGTMGLAGNTYALMVSGSGADSSLYRRLKVGEQLDGYTLVKVLRDTVVMNADGKDLDVRIADQPRPRSQPAVGGAGSGSKISAVGSTGNSAPVAGSASPQVPPGDALEGTVFNGKRKRIVPSPFGPTIVWEDVK